MRLIRLAMVLVLVSGPALPAELTLHGLHHGADVPCAACHLGGEPQASAVPPDSCATCHGTMVDPPEAGEEISFPDPHRSPHLGSGEVPLCTSCHGLEDDPEVTCIRCHRGFDLEAEALGMPGAVDED